MALPIMPQKVTSYGQRRLRLVDTIADTRAPEATELNAGDNITCFALSDQAGGTSNPNKITLPVLLCEVDAYQDFGTVTHEHADITLVYDPQGAPGSDGKTAWDAIVDGYTGNVVWELGFDGDADDTIVDGDRVTVVPAKLQVISEEPTSTGEDGLFAFQVAVAVTGPIRRNVAVGGDES